MQRIWAIAAALALTSCAAKKDSSVSDVDSLQASVESGIAGISGMADDESGGSYAKNQSGKASPIARIAELFVPAAWAASCGRAVTSNCSGGTRTATYSACSLPLTTRTMTGSVTLTYNDSSCSMSSTGAIVQRTYSVDINGPYGGTLSLSSASHADYRGTTFSGGGRITKTSGGWNLEVLGRHSVLSSGSKTLWDVSMRTLSALPVTGSLSRASRTITGGSFEVSHNGAGFTATYVPTNLTWSSLCCQPVSGTLNVTYSGSVTGSGTVTFNGCGSATLQKDGGSRLVTINYCE